MKLKKAVLILFSALLVFLSACAAEEAPPQETSEPEQKKQTELKPVEKPDKVAVIIDDMNEIVQENDVELLKINIDYATVDLNGFASEKKINSSLKESYDVIMKDADGCTNSAREYLEKTGDRDSLPFLVDRFIGVTRADAIAISLAYTDGLYTGGIHGNAWRYGENYDTETGELLHVADIATVVKDLEDYAVKRLPQIAAQSPHLEEFFDGWEPVAAGLLRDGNWVFSDEGITVFCTQYEMAPYSAGILEFTIPYSELKGLVRERFLMKNDLHGEGEVKVGFESDFDLSNENRTTIERDTEADGIFFAANGTVKDFRIFTVGYTVEDAPYADRTVYFVNRFTENDTVELKKFIPDTLPDIGISYISGEKTVTRYLTQSGENGDLLLIEQ